jgi:ferric-dicitrate binding protein FerR (iron transport regulator)
MTTHPSELIEAARLWAMRVADPAFDDWDGLTRWLETGPAHLAAYEAAVQDDEWAAATLAKEGPAKKDPRQHRR